MRYQTFKSFAFSILSTLISFLLLIFIGKIFALNLNSIKIYLLIVFLATLLSCTLYYLFFKKHISLKRNINSYEINNLKTAEKYRREFFGNVSHELKTPIFNIQGYIDTLLEGALYDKAVNKKYLKRTNKSVDRLIYIIKDLESISQLESEELKLDYKVWNLKNLINDIVDQFEIKSKQKKIQLVHDKKSTNCKVRADKDKISQVLYNLISNSIKYGKRGGTTRISCHQEDSKYLVSVKDNGIGIAEKNIKRLFERFYRVDKSRSREQGGTGLGLAIVKHIIEAHNQNISVKSSINKGSEFVFSLDGKGSV
tara:strand:- start:7817 stop:8749 length:933 start_codon:yes stop_codon:yes gene_type:complete